jgi:hypothetical protein
MLPTNLDSDVVRERIRLDPNRMKLSEKFAATASLPTEMDIKAGYALAARHVGGGMPLFDPAVTALRIAGTQTGVDGKYVLGDVAPGSYYVHAKISTPAVFAEWFVPVTVNSGEAAMVDLHNENATNLHTIDEAK